MNSFSTVILLFITMIASGQEWLADLGTGLEMARETDRKVLLLFSIPEDCTVCEKLEQRVFSDPEFLEYARRNVILVREDFSQTSPEAKSRHLAIVEKYNRDGFFPLVLLLDPAGRVIKKTGPYEGETASEYIAMLSGP